MIKRLWMVTMMVLMLAVTVQASKVGDQITYEKEEVLFHMRLAPAVTFPTGTTFVREATIDNPFWIAETQVTYELWYLVRQWALLHGYVFANPGREGSHGNEGQEPTEKKQQPVTRVSWYDSMVWTNALSEMLGYVPVYTYQGSVIKDAKNTRACDNAVQENTKGFRLPLSNEWELAARYKGDDSSHGAISVGGLWWSPGNYASGATADWQNVEATQEVAWYRDNSERSTKNVGLKKPNGLFLYDMSGNVWEWCFTQGGAIRVFRGAGFANSAGNLQVGEAFGGNPDGAEIEIGFRIVRTHW